MDKRLFVVIIMVFSVLNLLSQEPLLTVAEHSGYTSTSTYDDVMTFVGHLEKIPFFKG
jgi:hypothetical protein